MNQKLPNFLIVGATKCGTSSLHSYLKYHPQIFMSEVKEPRFISSQFTPFPLNGPGDHKVEKWYVKKFDDYAKLFENSGDAIAIGESSADTLYFYEKSIPVIKRYHGDPKIIIVLRNPVKRTFSAYQHLVRDEREKLTLEEALKEEPNRIKNNWELIYHYVAASKFYDSVKAFLENFSSVKIILNEDLEKKPQEVLHEIFNFLGVEPNSGIDTKIKYNVSGVPKIRWIHQFLFEGNKARLWVRPFVRLFFNHETRKKISYKIQGLNLSKMNLNPDTQKQLQDIFREDINNLQLLLNRDLSRWLL